ncbi:ABC transporter permease [Isoptericola croceus]|uniref:ABC transporter permease n=1 Tax=Isoptericola croceus TaxID=3031406 RepID=UPI0023F8A18B|nr:ABC transporter permease [Isoptericola croceus]
MTTVRTVLIAVRDLRASPLRNLLTALSMLVGVAAIVAVSAADQLVVSAVIAQQEQQQGRASTYEATLPLGEEQSEDALKMHEVVRGAVTDADASAALVASEPVTLRAVDGAATSFNLIQVEGDLQSVYRRPVVVGTWPRPESTLSPAVALNQEAADKLGILEVPAVLRWEVTTDRSATVVVSAILTDGQTEATAYGTWSAIAAARAEAPPLAAPRLLLTSSTVSREVLEQVVTDAAHRVGLPGPIELRRVDTVAETQQTVATARAALFVCGIAALVVAVLGILNVGLATVTERSRELVVRRAIGARRRDVAAQVIGSALLVSLLVAAVAVATVILVVLGVVPRLTSAAAITDPVTVPWPAVRDGIAAALLTGLAGALAPAVSASRLPVADALRA